LSASLRGQVILGLETQYVGALPEALPSVFVAVRLIEVPMRDPAVWSSAALQRDPTLITALSSAGHGDIISAECQFSERVVGLWTVGSFSLGNHLKSLPD
jgi:hypothetical protein